MGGMRVAWAALGLFAGLLFASVGFGFPLIFALLGGHGIFFGYGLLRRHSPKALWRMSLKGVRTVQHILFLFLLIGMITSLWRAAGTIPCLIYYAGGLISPAVFPLLAFLLCGVVSFLTGTSFGTAATMGTICMTMGTAMGVSPVLCAGSILSGAFFGDRCSPMSTSALLVAALTDTDLFRNLKRMMHTAAVPLALTCAVYLAAGFLQDAGDFSRGMLAPFAEGFSLHWVTVLPAVLIVALSLFRCKVKYTMALSIAASAVLCVALQGMSLPELLKTAVLGYTPPLPELKTLLSGGGLVSMAKPFCIVCISSTFSGLFEGTGLLDGMKELTARLAGKITAFGSLLAVSVVTSLISCNQTLAIMLSHALCRETFSDEQELAIGLENTAVVLAPLVPWSIAGAVPLASLHAPAVSLLAACYLYLIPVWNLLAGRYHRRRSQQEVSNDRECHGA